MKLTKYEPITFFDVPDLLDDFFGVNRVWNSNQTFTPRVNISEDENDYHLEVTLPGLKKNEVKIDLKGNQLTISGERKFNKDENGARYHLVENGYGKFNRSFTLSEDVDRDSIKARFEDGILKIDLKKSEKAVAKQIEIK